MDGNSGSGRTWLVSLFVCAILLGLLYVVWLSAGAPDSDLAGSSTHSPSDPTDATAPPEAGEGLPGSFQPSLLKVGIVAGHWQSDPGAVCADGLKEVTINLDVASRVVAILQSEGYQAELLPEFSDKLAGYRADAFVSIHADSCDVPEASGFKVARVSGSAIPDEEDRLVSCLSKEYGRATGLAFHADSITFDMTGYHAFGEIDPLTPGAIIELGFMDADRELLTGHSYELAQGVARGIACFLEGD